MGFSRQECWSGLPFPSPRDLPDPGIEPGSPTLRADAACVRAAQTSIHAGLIPQTWLHSVWNHNHPFW